MVLSAIGRSLPQGEKRRFFDPDVCCGTKSSRLEKKLAHSSTGDGPNIRPGLVSSGPSLPNGLYETTLMLPTMTPL